MSLPEQIVDAIHDISGRHEGTRAVHAKGVVCEGTFTATPEAAALTRAAHMQGEPVPATVRFSNGGGDPAAKDSAKDGRGLAVKLYLEDGSRTDMVAITLPPATRHGRFLKCAPSELHWQFETWQRTTLVRRTTASTAPT